MNNARSCFRLDRFLTLGVAARLPRVATGAPRTRLPILMYHGISHRVNEKAHPYYQTVTTPKRFHSHMVFLRDSGYCPMTLGQALRRLQDTSVETGDKPVVVTFDDGLRDFYARAFPILDHLDIPATVFLSSGYLDRRFVTGEECLRKVEVAELAARGVEFGSHTVTHPRLTDLGDPAIAAEIARSRDAIQDVTGLGVTLFSYPYRFPEEDGAFVRRLDRLLKDSGYRGGVTTRIGRASTADNPLFLKRLPINDEDDLSLFKAKLEGAYDWLHPIQLTSKRLRRLIGRARSSIVQETQ